MGTIQDLEYREESVSYSVESLRNLHFNTTGQYKTDLEILRDFIDGFKKHHKLIKEVEGNMNNGKIPFEERTVYRKLYDLLVD